jgi:hypothetical protein
LAGFHTHYHSKAREGAKNGSRNLEHFLLLHGSIQIGRLEYLTQYDTIQFVQGIDQAAGGRFKISTDGLGAYVPQSADVLAIPALL